HCAGKAGCSPLNLYARVRISCTFAHETAGAARTRLSLRPLLTKRVKSDAGLGHLMPRECGRISSRCLKFQSEVVAPRPGRRQCEACGLGGHSPLRPPIAECMQTPSS